MGLFAWLRARRNRVRDSGSGMPEDYPQAERRILLQVARDILAADNLLMQLTAASFGLGSAIAALRRTYGQDAVEANCPAEQLIAGYASGDTTHANRLLDNLIADLRAFEGDETRTYLRMAWMLNPTAIEAAASQLELSGTSAKPGSRD